MFRRGSLAGGRWYEEMGDEAGDRPGIRYSGSRWEECRTEISFLEQEAGGCSNETVVFVEMTSEPRQSREGADHVINARRSPTRAGNESIKANCEKKRYLRQRTTAGGRPFAIELLVGIGTFGGGSVHVWNKRRAVDVYFEVIRGSVLPFEELVFSGCGTNLDVIFCRETSRKG